MSDPTATQTACNGHPHHAWTTQRGPNSQIWVQRCSLCGEIDWQELANEIAELTASSGVDEVVARAQERAACVRELRDYAWNSAADLLEKGASHE
ncbi:hypothetical protein ACIBQ6_21910 [Nonomuraea sp. NPDC049655]|uniref:hypothetical protein n=1 Tax=Nonomuraea sp. NPDC049655 TaxID=3364355 RepID=UPI0037968AEC